jgi:hypothetical protein
MLDSDFSTFDRAFGRVCGAFRRTFKANEAEDLTRTYFKILEAHPLALVLRAGKQLMSVSRKFPLAADWLATVEALAHQTPDVRQMTTTELDVYASAEAARWEGGPCGCAACVTAGSPPIRFVPTCATADTYEQAYNPRTQRVQLVGHWAHGAELASWYRARAACFASAPQTFKRVLALVSREVGVEG